MKQILIMDEKDYTEDMGVMRRIAVRAVTFIDGKLLLIQNNRGELKLPGGGIEPGEDDPTALIREVKEETGYDIIPDTIREFGEVEEKRLSKHEPMIWHQTNRLYLCDVYPAQGQCSYTEKERVRGYRQVLFSLDDAIEQNKRVLEREGVHTWNQREYKTMLLIRERLFGNEDRT